MDVFIVTFKQHRVFIYLQIQPNGIITFTHPNFSESTSTTTPKPLPIQDLDFIAPYWFDGGLLNICNETLSVNTTATPNASTSDNETSAVNETSFFNETSENSVNDTSCRNTITVYYRQCFSYSLQERATREIRANFLNARHFFARYLFIITWIITNPKDHSSNPVIISIIML